MASITLKRTDEELRRRRRRAAAVADLDLDIKDNQFVTLLGPSGCGKTTTLRMIAGYIVPDAGTIHVDGRLVSVARQRGAAGPARHGHGVPELRGVAAQDGVRERRVRPEDPEDAGGRGEAARSRTPSRWSTSPASSSRYPNELSGGQQQRVALARSLVVEPEILLLDEPLSNLDAKLREHMRGELKQLQRRTGITFVYVTHDQAEALALSDHIAVIHGGRLQQYGTPYEVYARPANRMVADFMGLVNLVPGKVRAPRTAAARIEAAGDLSSMSR